MTSHLPHVTAMERWLDGDPNVVECPLCLAADRERALVGAARGAVAKLRDEQLSRYPGTIANQLERSLPPQEPER